MYFSYNSVLLIGLEKVLEMATSLCMLQTWRQGVFDSMSISFYFNFNSPIMIRPDSDASGNGIKPFAINEMSMLAHYHEIEPKELMLLPVVPAHEYILNKYVCNMSHFGPGGSEVS